MATMTDAELEALLKEDNKPQTMSDDEVLAHLNDEVQAPQEMSLGKGLAKTAVQALPMAGSLAGAAIVGGPTLGAGALGGSALGAMAGRAAQTLIEENFLNEQPKPLLEKFTELPKEAVYDVAGNVTSEKIIGPAIGLAMKGVGKAYNKVAGGISKVPESVMETMQSRYSNVEGIPDVSFAADVLREQMQQDVKSFKTAQNMGISSAVREKGQQTVNIKSVRDTLNSVKSRLDPNINPEKIARIQKELDILDKVVDRPQQDAEAVSQYLRDLDLYEKEVARAAQSNEPVQMKLPELPVRQGGQFNPIGGDDLLPLNQQLSLKERSARMNMGRANKGQQLEINTTPQPPTPPSFQYGEVAADQAYQISQRLQNLADYTADGQALKKKDLIDVVFARAAGKARNEVQKVIPEVAEFNKKLANLHVAGKNINKNMLTPDKPYNAIIGIGTGENKLASRQLERFQNVIGKDYKPQMQDIAAAQYFANAGLLPGEKTGSSLAPLIVSGGLGLSDMASGNFGQGAAKLALGLPLTPIVIKTTLGVKSAAKNVLGKMGVTPAKIGSESVQAISPYLLEKMQSSPDRTPQGQQDVMTVLQMMSPYDREQYIKKDNSITPTQKAVLLKQNRNAR